MLELVGVLALIDCLFKTYLNLKEGHLDLGLTATIIFIACALFYIN